MKTLKYITRIDSNSTHCWWVRIQEVPKPTYIQKSFSDGQYGGKRKARLAAIEFRDKTLAKMPKQRQLHLHGKRRWGKGYCLMVRTRPNGVVDIGWIAHYWDTIKKKQRKKYFSVNKYGYRKAMQLAKQHREFMLTGEL